MRFQGDFQDSLPRSRSYSGKSKRSSSTGSGRPKSNRRHSRGSSENRVSRHSHHHHNNHSQTSKEEASRTRHHHRSQQQSAQKNFNMVEGDSDSNSVCSTCSSSSSSGDELYDLPQRRHYGGVRVNYVPNDALAIARKQQQKGVGGELRSVTSSAVTPTAPDDNKDKNCIIS